MTAHHTNADDERSKHEHDHPSEFVYVKVAVLLAVLTAIEVALSYAEFGTTATIACC